MKNLLEFIIKNIVSKPENVKIQEEQISPDYINIQLSVDPSDMSLVIGKQGRIIKSIRNILRIKAINKKIKFNLKLIEKN